MGLRPYSCLAPLLLLLGCPAPGQGPEPTPDPTPAPRSGQTLADYAANGEYGVGQRTLFLEDTTRVTPASGEQAELPSRSISVELWYPAATGSVGAPARDADVLDPGHPLLVFSHGFMSSRLDSPKLCAHLASHGYVVVAPEFPLSSRTSGTSPDASDVTNQPGDVSFVLDTILADPEFTTDDIAAGGISLGGMTTLMVGLVPEYRDDRIDVLLPLTPATCLLPLDALAAETPPLLLAHGTSDAILPYDGHVLPFWDATRGPRRLVTFVEGTHTGFADVTEDLLDGADHADSLGCGQIEGAVNDPDPEELVGTLNPECPGICEEVLGVAMRPTRQGLLTRALAHAFLDAGLRGDEDAALWLDAGLGLQNDDVIVEIGE